MSPTDGADLTNGEIARTLKRLDDGQKELVSAQRDGQKAVMDQLTLMRGEFIHRTEWDMQNRIHSNDLADVENDMKDRDARREADVKEAHKSVAALKRALVAVVAFVVTSVLGIVTAYIQSGRL